jgi:multiple sugar transport system substrate-binding protein
VVGAGAALAGGAVLGAPSLVFGAPVVRVAERGRYQDVTEVTFHHIWGTPPGQAATRADNPVENVINLFNEKNTGVRVISRTDSGSYAEVLQKTQVEMAAGNPPDLVSTPWASINYASEGLGLVDLEDVAGEDVSEVLDNLREDVVPLVQVEGKTKGMPYAFSNPLMYYNQDIFDEAGITVDDVMNEWDFYLGDAAKALSDHVGGPILGMTDGAWGAQGIIQSNGGLVMTDDNVFVMDSPETIESMAKIAELDRAGMLNRSTRDEEVAAFVSGALPICYFSVASLSGLREQVQFTMNTHTFPTFGDKPRKMSSGGSFIGMYSQDEAKKQAAWEFLKFAASEEGYEPWSKMGYLNATVFDFPVLEGQEPAYTQLEEGVTRETPWPTERGAELQRSWAEMVARIWLNDISSEEGCTSVAAELNSLLG